LERPRLRVGSWQSEGLRDFRGPWAGCKLHGNGGVAQAARGGRLWGCDGRSIEVGREGVGREVGDEDGVCPEEVRRTSS
jgi:hypothetical protein